MTSLGGPFLCGIYFVAHIVPLFVLELLDTDVSLRNTLSKITVNGWFDIRGIVLLIIID